MTAIENCIYQVRRRQQRQWLWQCTSLGLLLASIGACCLAALRWPMEGYFSWQLVVGTLIAGPMLGAIYATVRRRSVRDAAASIDRSCNLKDRMQTALGFLQRKQSTSLHALQIADAEKHVGGVDMQKVAPVQNPRSFPYAIGLSLLALLLIAVTMPKPVVVASIAPDETVVSVTQRASEGLEELKELQVEINNPELEKLLEELEVQLEQMNAAELDPKDAMAKLSVMEAALQDVQNKLSDPTLDAELQQLGETLSLSESMAAAGSALAKGEMEKAAEELAKLELPKLDLKTEKAITEKLNEMRSNDGDAAQKRKQLKEAMGQVSDGLTQGDRNKFKDGVDGLAGECKKQGQRKKLTDLLRKQCQCLSECKSECEGACKSLAESNKKGGKNFGLARSNNEPGDKTAMLKTNPQMNITGQDSGQGDVDLETEEAPQQDQQAVRQYREKIDKYEALSESVLASESIPLGQRQTIRRYFESIRPTHQETDAVMESTFTE